MDIRLGQPAAAVHITQAADPVLFISAGNLVDLAIRRSHVLVAQRDVGALLGDTVVGCLPIPVAVVEDVAGFAEGLGDLAGAPGDVGLGVLDVVLGQLALAYLPGRVHLNRVEHPA